MKSRKSTFSDAQADPSGNIVFMQRRINDDVASTLMRRCLDILGRSDLSTIFSDEKLL